MNTTTQSNAVMASLTTEATKAAAKKENYSAETTTALLKAYESEKDTEKLAAMFGKTVKSIVAKLSREKVYIKPTYKTKTGEVPISKEELVSKIAVLLNKDEESLESLTKATKPVLQTIEAALRLQSELLDMNEGDSFEQLSANDGVLEVSN